MKEKKNQEKNPNSQEKSLPFFSYNQTVYTPDLKPFAEKMLEFLPPYKKGEHLHLITSSSSGAFIASAMMVLSDRKIDVLYVRKEKEYSHAGSPGVNRSYLKYSEFIFVDDAIASGGTLERCISYLSRESTAPDFKGITRVIIATGAMINSIGKRALEDNKIQKVYSALEDL